MAVPKTCSVAISDSDLGKFNEKLNGVLQESGTLDYHDTKIFWTGQEFIAFVITIR